MNSPTVVISGIGAYSGFGQGTSKLWDCIAGKESIFGKNLSGNVFDIALSSGQEAIKSSGLISLPAETGFVLGTNVGNVALLSKAYGTDSSLTFSIDHINNWANHQVLADEIGKNLGIYKKVSALTGACASGALAIGYAFDLISRGISEVVLAGGADENTEFKSSGHHLIKSASISGQVKPFDINRDGTVFSGGAGFLILESLEHCLKRNHKPMALISGYGVGTDLNSFTAPDENGIGAEIAIRSAIKDAQLLPESINHIQAHGTGTKLNDIIESKVIERVFGKNLSELTVSADKGSIGHTFGASGVLSIILTVLMIQKNIVLPITGCETPDPSCTIPLVVNEERKNKITAAICNNFGFGGCNVSIVVQCYEDPNEI